MSIRHVGRRVVVSLAATAAAGSFAALAFSSPAGAAGPSSGTIVPGSAQPGPFTPGTPFDSGQTINVSFRPTRPSPSPTTRPLINIVECSAPNGVVPTQPSACDGNTIQGDTILRQVTGRSTYAATPCTPLPNAISLGEGRAARPVGTPRPQSASSTSGTTRTTSRSRICGRSHSSSTPTGRHWR